MHTLIPQDYSVDIPKTFDMDYYMECEREFWALFPESDGHRVNFAQIGLCSWLLLDVPESEPEADTDNYVLMVMPDYTMRPIRMRLTRRLTSQEHRWSVMSAIKLIGKVDELHEITSNLGMNIMGEEIQHDLDNL